MRPDAPARPESSSMTAADVEAYAGATVAGRRLYLYGSVGQAGGGPQCDDAVSLHRPGPVRTVRADGHAADETARWARQAGWPPRHR